MAVGDLVRGCSAPVLPVQLRDTREATGGGGCGGRSEGNDEEREGRTKEVSFSLEIQSKDAHVDNRNRIRFAGPKANIFCVKKM